MTIVKCNEVLDGGNIAMAQETVMLMVSCI